jgi:hypothetical protein
MVLINQINLITNQSITKKNMFSKYFPAIHYFVENYGNIEIGEDEKTNSLIRLTDDGGTLYEDRRSETIDDAIKEAEEFLKDYFFENYEIKI